MEDFIPGALRKAPNRKARIQSGPPPLWLLWPNHCQTHRTETYQKRIFVDLGEYEAIGDSPWYMINESTQRSRLFGGELATRTNNTCMMLQIYKVKNEQKTREQQARVKGGSDRGRWYRLWSVWSASIKKEKFLR
ncbi:unnamed protein product [Rhizoctonia solani]|uniref:Uncharacterized protein n=1 Tax=Rhizoctonia solani TaxID=456999 RepID=A0A8H3E071_9AGAM|nr:unnamed protein product [Rhizoctonia solani]